MVVFVKASFQLDERCFDVFFFCGAIREWILCGLQAARGLFSNIFWLDSLSGTSRCNSRELVRF